MGLGREAVHDTWYMDKHMNSTINVPRLPLGRCYRPYRNTHVGNTIGTMGQYNADFYVGGAMANTFPMMRKGTAGHAIRPPVGYFT